MKRKPVSGLLIGYGRVSSDAQDLTARVAAASGDNPDVLSHGNLDTDIPPFEEAMRRPAPLRSSR
jgi:hypothetical protein